MSSKESKRQPLEEGLVAAMRALDNQIEREINKRLPGDRDEKGIQKWSAYSTRVENVCSLLLNSLNDGDVQIDSLLVLAQAFTKTLQLVVDDLGKEGLGKVREAYCVSALTAISDDTYRALQSLKGETSLN